MIGTAVTTWKVTKFILDDAWPFLQKHWKKLFCFGGWLLFIICCLTKCNGRPEPQIVTEVHTDTVYEVDESWKKLLGDTVAFYEQKLTERIWVAPTIQLTDNSTTSDSLAEYKGAAEWAIGALDDCDSTYRADYALRYFNDTIPSDSLDLIVNAKIRGRYEEKPTYKWTYKIPNKTVTNTITTTVTVGPFRSVFVGGGAGPQFNALDTIGRPFRGIEVELHIGYMDKKYNQFAIEGEYDTRNNYAVLFTYRRNFPFGK